MELLAGNYSQSGQSIPQTVKPASLGGSDLGIAYRAWEREGRRVTVSTITQKIESGSSSTGLGTILSRSTSPTAGTRRIGRRSGGVESARNRDGSSVRRSATAKTSDTGASRTENGPIKTGNTRLGIFERAQVPAGRDLSEGCQECFSAEVLIVTRMTAPPRAATSQLCISASKPLCDVFDSRGRARGVASMGTELVVEKEPQSRCYINMSRLCARPSTWCEKARVRFDANGFSSSKVIAVMPGSTRTGSSNGGGHGIRYCRSITAVLVAFVGRVCESPSTEPRGTTLIGQRIRVLRPPERRQMHELLREGRDHLTCPFDQCASSNNTATIISAYGTVQQHPASKYLFDSRSGLIGTGRCRWQYVEIVSPSSAFVPRQSGEVSVEMPDQEQFSVV
ncbi:hypothetical protein B0T13DRAFT_449139 [Neurospora crassa]|nr:hypothetical protein B0T13DRAFT_449139 [Neurospora crassa]